MFKGFRRKVGISYSRLLFRQHRDRVMDFTDALAGSRRALIIYPESAPDGDGLASLVRYLSRKFSSEGMTVLVRDDQKSSLDFSPAVKTLTYSEKDINAWLVPRQKLLKRMKTKQFDVVLDLNRDLALPGALLCKASEAPLRVSFEKQEADRFYNFQVRTGEHDASRSYRSLQKCLEMF